MQTSQKRPIIIAIDGYSSSGKSSMAKALAKTIGYHYVDTGAMYRAVTLYAMRNGLIDNNGTPDSKAIADAMPLINIGFILMPDGSQHTSLNDEDVENEIRGLDVSNNVSAVSAIPEVRHDLVVKQQAFGKSKGIVMDGRDIGTTVFPSAELKIFVNAPATTRAMRRLKELVGKGIHTTYEEVLENIESRDRQDENRKESPLRRAHDAIDLDNTDMTIQQQDQWLIDRFNEAVEKHPEL